MTARADYMRLLYDDATAHCGRWPEAMAIDKEFARRLAGELSGYELFSHPAEARRLWAADEIYEMFEAGEFRLAGCRVALK